MSVRDFALAVTSSGDLSQATVTIGPVDLRSIPAAALQLAWTGSPVGTLQLQGTTGQPTNSSTAQTNSWPGPWSPVGTAVGTSGINNYTWDITSTGLSAVQVVYTRTSGTGTITLARGQQKS